MRVYRLMLVVVTLSGHTLVTMAGILDDFERDATEDRPRERHRDHYEYDHWRYRHQYDDGRRRPSRQRGRSFGFDWEREPHRLGEPVLPFARFDGGHQTVETNVEARDYYAQVGYEMIGLDVRHTRFTETNPSDHLDLYRIHGLLRLGGAFGSGTLGQGAQSFWEVDVGLGYVQLAGNNRQGAFSFTLPILLYPSKHWGLEFRPAWATINDSTLQDYDLSAHFLLKYVGLKVGYRWLKSPNMDLSGPYVGAVTRF